MTRWYEYAAFLALTVLLAHPVSRYLLRVFDGQKTVLDPICRPVERQIYRWLGVDPQREMSAGLYFLCFLAFSMVGTVLLFLLLILQRWLPGGPDESYLTTPMTPDLAANTAVSFSTTTTWQAYGGESTLRYLTQVVGLAVQNFLAGAAGLAVGVAFIRGFAREGAATLGNFWVDLVRALLWVLLPLSLRRRPGAGLAGGAAQLRPPTSRRTRCEGAMQTIAQGPVAALELIKNLGTNGGGLLQRQRRAPLREPDAADELPRAAGDRGPARRHSRSPSAGWSAEPRAGWVLLAVMVVLFVAGLVVCDLAESAIPPRLADLGRRRRQHGGQGGPVRGRRFGAGRGGHLERRDRVVQLDARLVPADRRAGAAGQHAARRGRRSGAWDRPLQPGDGGPGGGLHGRADGRPLAGVPGQDDQVRPRRS